MGEEEKKAEEEKEEKKAEEEKEEKKEIEEKKDDEMEEEAQEIELKVDMHCEACARKVVRSLKGFPGVDGIITDYKVSKVIVKGKEADPLKVSERIQKKTGRKVVIISPVPKSPEEVKEEKKEEPPKEEKKEEPPAVMTIVLSVRIHCEACAQTLQKRIRKIKGVESVILDVANDQAIVKGVLDPGKLVNDVCKRTGKHVSVVKEEEKQDEEKKEEKQDEKEEEEENKEDETKVDINKNEYWPPRHYYMEQAYAPQMFSDENPNACTVM